MELEDLIKRAYVVFNKGFYKLDVYEYTPDEKDLSMIQTFIKLCDKEYDGTSGLGVNFVYDYFVLQYDYWIAMQTKKNSGIKPMAWIIGKKAFKRFTGRSKEFSWYHAKKQSVSRGIHADDIYKEEVINSVSDLSESEETEKKLFHNNGDLGLLHCSNHTSLYNGRSPLCLTCNNKKDCKKLLEDNYPELFIKRGYLKKEKV